VDTTSELLVLDAVFTADLWDTNNGRVQGASGFQYRDASLEMNRDPDSVEPGTYIFVGGGNEYDQSQDVYALFAELAVPLNDRLDLQLAARYEDYGGDTGDTFDPKIAFRWTATQNITLRASASTTFRAPTLNQQYSRDTGLVSLVDGTTTGFKAVDASGNPMLKPEDATTYNIGLLFNPTDNITASLDYWRFEFEDIIGVENGQTIVSIENLLCPQRTPDCRDPNIIRNAITGEDPDDNLQHSGEIVRVISSYVNAPGVDTDGLDIDFKWNLSSERAGDFVVAVQGMYMFDYTISGIPGIQDGQVGNVTIDAAGNRNEQNFARPLPEWKASLTLGWTRESHKASAIVRHITDYTDDKTLDQEFNRTIDAMTTVDLHYSYSFNQDRTRISLGIFNAADEDPPFADQDLNFDARTHNPFGRMYQVVMRHQFEM
jgi:outer membrane receptor protein involved in Fe transport